MEKSVEKKGLTKANYNHKINIDVICRKWRLIILEGMRLGRNIL